MSGVDVAIRVDATARIGTGHIMRCLTLGRMLKAHGMHVRFISRELLDSMRALLTMDEMEYRELPSVQGRVHPDTNGPPYADWLGVTQATDAEQTLAVLSDRHWNWLVVDHYALDRTWEEAMAPLGARLFCIDDLADRPHICDLLLDQNYYANAESRYANMVPEHCKLMLGPDYALLRDEFRQQQAHVQVRTGPVRRLLIFFGGVDIDNLTERALDALALISSIDFDVDVVIGAHHPALVRIEARCAKAGYHCHVQTQHMAELMASADLAIGGGGIANIERIAMGVPSLVAVLADNQRQAVRDLANAGLLVEMGEASNLTADVIENALVSLLDDEVTRNQLSRQCITLIPYTVEQHPVLEAMDIVAASEYMYLRPANWDDTERLLSWRNDPQTRAASHHSDPIDLADHQAWFRTILASENCHIYVAMERGVPVGTVRADCSEEDCMLSWTVAPDIRGHGVAKRMMSLMAEKFVGRIRAEVKRDNVASARIAESVGMRLVGEGGDMCYYQREALPAYNRKSSSDKRQR